MAGTYYSYAIRSTSSHHGIKANVLGVRKCIRRACPVSANDKKMAECYLQRTANFQHTARSSMDR